MFFNVVVLLNTVLYLKFNFRLKIDLKPVNLVPEEKLPKTFGNPGYKLSEIYVCSIIFHILFLSIVALFTNF